MLILSRHTTEEIVVDLRPDGRGLLTIKVTKIRDRDGGTVWLGIDADPSVPVHRREVFDAIELAKGAA